MASKKNISISSAKMGMNKDSHFSNLKPEEYTHAKNSNFLDDGGNSYNMQNEHSNLLASRFSGTDFKVIGSKNDINSNATYYFFKNPTTGESEIGIIKNINNLPDLSDDVIECDECEYKTVLSEPLENQNQIETQTYQVIFNDQCNGCLNFDINFPIKSIEIKNEKCGKVMYFTDNLNPPRYIELDNLDKYRFTGEELCGDDSGIEETCVACDKMLVFRRSKILDIQPAEIVLGGNLKLGTYEFIAAYSDENGNETSRYFSITNPIPIFDSNNNILEQSDLANETNFAIKLNITNLDLSNTHYKVAVIQRTDISAATSYFIEGVHSTSDNQIIYTTDQGKERTTLSNLNKPAVRLDKAETLTSANGYLFLNGLTRPKALNLQPVINLMSPFLNWQSYIAKENLYEDGVASAKYKGYYRDETYPIGIRFLLDGEYSPIYHFIGRPPTETDNEEIDNEDSESASKLSSSCVGTTINKRWQIYNTARELGTCSLSEDIPTNTITEDIEKVCLIEEVGELTNGSISISLDEATSFIDLETYIEDNRDFLIDISNLGNCTDNYSQGLCDLADLVNPDNYPENCTPNFEDSCGTPEFISSQLDVNTIEGENIEQIPRDYPEDYSILPSPNVCSLHRVDFSTGSKKRDTEFEINYFWGSSQSNPEINLFTVYERDYNATNESCSNAEDLISYNQTTQYIPSYFHNYYGADTLEELQTDYLTHPDCFNNPEDEYISKGALWFKKDFSQENEFIFEVTPQNIPSDQDVISQNNQVRLNIFDNCSSTSLYCVSYAPNDGFSLKVRVDSGNLYLTDDTGVEVNIGTVTGQDLYFVLDCPIAEAANKDEETTYVVRPTQGCFGVLTKPIQFKRVDITFDTITVDKSETYKATCDFEVPVVEDCEAYPYKYGEFAYTESTEEYPDNAELYNSSRLSVSPEDLPSDEYYDNTTYREHFKETYNLEEIEGNYILTEEQDFRCKPIRHFKFPDNSVSPFMYENRIAGFSESIIYPIGITINEEVINSFLDIAVKNKLITQQQRDSIQGYEIVRGDRTANESIKTKGIVYDMMKYQEDSKDVLYANYPFNDLGSDRLNFTDSNRDTFIPHPYNGLSNNSWAFTSPETHKDVMTLPPFMKVDGYMFGRSSIYFHEVEDHPEWVILGDKLKNLASTLATIEVIAEGIINIAESSEAYRVQVGFANSANPVGIGMNIAVAVLSTVTGAIFNYSRYKYEWLETFRNLGSPRNFVYSSTAVGNMNYFKPNTDEGQQFRYLNVRKNIKGSRLILTDSVGGKQLTVNHTDRDRTVLLSTGEDYPITYDTDYSSYDNSNVDFNTSSRTFASENNACTSGRSKEVIRNVASMYVALKGYLPSQYGTIGSVKWLTTGYRGDLNNPRVDCLGIFGGDVFITRNYKVRRMPLFLTTALNQADLTPFEYKFYSNIGTEPRFYCDYAINTEDASAGRPIPDVSSEYNFDCFSGKSGNYVKEPSKMYLDYNGISSYLVETTINTHNRYGKKEPWNNFYPNVGDPIPWLQRKINDINRETPFFYNNTYSKSVTQTATLTLPSNYNQQEYDCKTDSPNGTMYSLPDNSENAYLDPWLIFRPLDQYEFPSEYGDLIELRGIETAQVLGRFENQTVIFNAVDVITEDNNNPTTQILGDGGIFAKRPRTFADTDLGYAGSQTQQMVSCEYGHFFVDADRGQVFKIANGGQGIEEISAYSNGQPSGMRQWFKKHLPFKIKKQFPEIDVDNPWNGAGITMGWDSMYRRVFITKKDYKITNSENLCVDSEGILRDSSDIQPTIDDYVNQGYVFDGIENCRMKFIRKPLNLNTDIFAILDGSGSFDEQQQGDIEEAIQSFYDDYQTNNPNYTGDLIISTRTEGWMSYINEAVTYYGSNFEDKSVLIISFCNESATLYHPNTLNQGYTPEQIQKYQEAITNHQLYVPQFQDFKAIAYPIITTDTIFENQGKALIQQTIYALEGRDLTLQEAENIPQNTAFTPQERADMEANLQSNPYSYLNTNGFKSFGWRAQLDLNDISGNVITNQRFKEDIEDLIFGGNITEEEVLYVDLPVAKYEQFEDVSWTISYSVDTGKWSSFFDFKPNYYVSHNEYFQTGINNSQDETEIGLWSHLLTNKSFNVFYGKAYDWEIEIPSTNKGDAKSMESFTYNLDVRRYKNEYDYFQNKKIGFEEAIIWNQSNVSGKLKLDLQTSVRQSSKYPKTNGDTQSILQTTQDGEFRFNYFYNRYKDNDSMLNIWNSDENEIDKQLNPQAVSFYNKRVLERLRGNVFLVNLKSSETQHKKIFTIAKTKETIYDK